MGIVSSNLALLGQEDNQLGTKLKGFGVKTPFPFIFIKLFLIR